MTACVHALAIATGLDQLNGKRSQAEVAREIGCTRARISHYVIAFRDMLSDEINNFDYTKYRKANSTRETYKAKATDKHTIAKDKVIKAIRAKLRKKK
jgi:predicted transcriptional regulator